jgi:hypothetical protein
MQEQIKLKQGQRYRRLCSCCEKRQISGNTTSQGWYHWVLSIMVNQSTSERRITSLDWHKPSLVIAAKVMNIYLAFSKFKIKNDQLAFAQQDLFLLENQLPYQLLKDLMKLRAKKKELKACIRPFINIVVKINCLRKIKEERKKRSNTQIKNTRIYVVRQYAYIHRRRQGESFTKKIGRLQQWYQDSLKEPKPQLHPKLSLTKNKPRETLL